MIKDNAEFYSTSVKVRLNSINANKNFRQDLPQSKNFCTFAADYQKTTVNTSRNNSTFQSNENFSRENVKFMLENLAIRGILLEREREREREMSRRITP
jgi:hypothetical protein